MLNKKNVITTLIMVLIVLSVGGVSALAERSIPGDTLYKLKTVVNEPVAAIFALTQEEKTEWAERMVERRLYEAQKLISQNRLDETTRLELQKKIKTKISEFNTNLNELSLIKNQSINSSNLNIRLQASLTAYANIYRKLLLDIKVDEPIKQEVEKFVIALSESDDEIKSAHANLELHLNIGQPESSGATDTVANSATGKQNTALVLLNSIKLSYQKDKINLSANTQNKINDKLSQAEFNLEEGDNFIVAGDYTSALSKFQTVISRVNEAKLLILSNIIKGNIEEDMGVEDDEEIEND